MTTEVTVCIGGNRAVKISTPQGDYEMKPGRVHRFLIHGDQKLEIQETGEFLDYEPTITKIVSEEHRA